ncbi:MAG: LysM peptidoglycan-binding domain-containing protein, partial [Calditrichaeota bacterium]
KEIGCSLEELQLLNPELLRRYTPPNTKGYIFKVPKGKSDKFWAAYDGMPSPKETSWVQHQIRRGETVSTIAAKYGVSQYAIFEANNLSRRSKIYAGKKLIVPVPLDKNYNNNYTKPTKRTASNSIYAVQSGDTMWDIAKAFGTTVSELRRANSIVRGSRIYVGQKLRIPSSAKNLKQKSSSTYASKSNSSKSSNSSTAKTYKVKSGDTLWDIARKFGTTTASIRNQNSLGRSSRIYPGQILNVNTNVNYVWHKVRRGETLSSIAQRYRTSIARIRANNNIDDPHTLQIGTNLKIY